MTSVLGADRFAGRPPGRTTGRRGLLDAVLAALLVYVVYAGTPIGALAETAINVARGQRARPSWLATFRGRDTAVRIQDVEPVDAGSAGTSTPRPIARAAARQRVDADALAALIALRGTCEEERCTAQAPPRLGAVLPEAAGQERVDADVLARALSAARPLLGPSPELAIEALFVGPVALKLALEQARRGSFATGDHVEEHAAFFAPSTRRGPLQDALAVVAAYRLRTLAWPADARWPITSSFGDRLHPVTHRRAFHNGTDIGVPVGTALHAAQRGRIKRSSRDSISGSYVVVDHGLGIETIYCHLSDATAIEGEGVRRRDPIGRSGASGRVTGPHLHYTVLVQGKPVDAERYGESPTRARAAVADGTGEGGRSPALDGSR
jgi:murein DD-endopeptidase MepM/ murein hydrolase activator NlpD